MENGECLPLNPLKGTFGVRFYHRLRVMSTGFIGFIHFIGFIGSTF